MDYLDNKAFALPCYIGLAPYLVPWFAPAQVLSFHFLILLAHDGNVLGVTRVRAIEAEPPIFVVPIITGKGKAAMYVKKVDYANKGRVHSYKCYHATVTDWQILENLRRKAAIVAIAFAKERMLGGDFYIAAAVAHVKGDDHVSKAFVIGQLFDI